MNEARRYGIPIIVLVDVDRQLAREVIDKYMEKGYSWLFDEQVRFVSGLSEMIHVVISKGYQL